MYISNIYIVIYVRYIVIYIYFFIIFKHNLSFLVIKRFFLHFVTYIDVTIMFNYLYRIKLDNIY